MLEYPKGTVPPPPTRVGSEDEFKTMVQEETEVHDVVTFAVGPEEAVERIDESYERKAYEEVTVPDPPVPGPASPMRPTPPGRMRGRRLL